MWVKDVIKVDLPRPRDEDVLESDGFIALRHRLRKHLAQDMAAMRMIAEET